MAEEMKKVLVVNETQTDMKGGNMCLIVNILVLVTTNNQQFGHGLLGGQTKAA